MSEEPATKHRKRVRQACEPCRRKKGRCSGEKPICALCARLGQACTWADSIEDSYAVDIQRTPGPSAEFETIQAGSTSSPRHRAVNFLEDKLDEVLIHVRTLAGVQDLSAAKTRSAEVERLRPIELPSSEVVRKAAGLYLQYCHNQPIPLFVPHQFDARLLTLDPELQLCVCVVALRFESDFLNAYAAETSSYIETARSLVMKKIVGASQVELSTIQALCLMCLADWNNGMAQRAGTYLAIATELARSSRLDLYARSPTQHSRYHEYVRCIWSIVMLQYLCGGVGVFTTSINTNGLSYPPSSTSNHLALAVGQLPTSTGDASDLGVVAYAIQMTEAWYRVRQYVQHRGKQDVHPPWSSHSMYAKIMFHQMELESQMPHKHRFKRSGFTEHDISVLSTNRQYWAPWLYLQLVYHAIVCTLNHPLLLSLHLKRFRVKQVPELFLQHIQDILSTHTDWVVHLLDIATEKQFTFSDPFLAQFIAIVGTIFLQQSFTTDADARAARHSKYERCLRFVQNLGGYWLCAVEKAEELQNFERTVTAAFSSSTVSPQSDVKTNVDLTLFWKILDNTTAATMASNSSSIFGSSLRLHPRTSDHEAEMLSTQLLPDPTRVNSLPYFPFSTASTPVMVNGGHPDTFGRTALDSSDAPFLAQNFFAIGQDFVGNAEDWFNWNDT